jgi:hypothetical protein
MRAELDITEIADFTKSISEYLRLANYYKQLDQTQTETLEELHSRVMARTDKGSYMDHIGYQYWKEINVHMILQGWGNTSGGWQGMGGSAMTNSYTVIIENKWFDAIFVYYGGKLAYIADAGEKLKPFRERGFRNLPGHRECSEKLDVFYRNLR